jgi:hypothetical protein
MTPDRRAIMPRTTSRVTRNRLLRFDAIIASQSVSSIRANGMTWDAPALLTRTSMRPSRARASATARRVCAASVRSAAWAEAPVSRASAAAASARDLYVKATSTPSRRSRRTTAPPTAPLPPVTSAVRFMASPPAGGRRG